MQKSISAHESCKAHVEMFRGSAERGKDRSWDLQLRLLSVSDWRGDWKPAQFRD